jgi:hypothetical protein
VSLRFFVALLRNLNSFAIGLPCDRIVVHHNRRWYFGKTAPYLPVAVMHSVLYVDNTFSPRVVATSRPHGLNDGDVIDFYSTYASKEVRSVKVLTATSYQIIPPVQSVYGRFWTRKKPCGLWSLDDATTEQSEAGS